MQQSTRIHRMKAKAAGVQATVSIVRNFVQACDYAVGLTARQSGQTIAAPGLSADQQKMLNDRCQAADLHLLPTPLIPGAPAIHTALTHADWGIAETGTLVIDSRSEDLRIATMLSDIHVAILPADRIKPDARALEGEINSMIAGSDPAYLSFITGASRTADIERVLAIGVHGPKRLHILISTEDEV